MVSKNNSKAVLATLTLMVLSLSVASSVAISIPHYASAQGVTVEGGGVGNATNATMIGAGNATNATSAGGGETAGGTQIGGPLSLYGGGGGQ
ncbi:MAG TPA: hypothetical protein VKA87_00930 [Nitrososphaeraceae archaeon]|nr:hypothetical protein [Nitrososphaeraceae archaeon]